ncbi:MAG: hypothetical protein E7607_07735 [Ruminococcaceae bacterium]|nr:hypothetical protein [Oscillospiraceae bacterium]
MGKEKKKRLCKSPEKEVKNEKTKKIISYVAMLICAAVIIGAILFIVFHDRIIASKMLKDAVAFAEAERIEAVVISNDSIGDPLSPGVQTVYEGEDSEKINSVLISVLKNSKYKGTTKADTGVWKTKIVLYNETESFSLYADNGGVYILSDGRLIRYKVSRKAESEFGTLLGYINGALKE